MKKKLKRILVVLIIAALSVGIGFAYDRYDHSKKLEKYPRKYQTEISVLSYEHSVPTSVIYAVIKVSSDFDASFREDGKTGLFALTDDQYTVLETRFGNEPTDPGLLYQPETSLRLGVSYLGELFLKYGKWKTVFAAFFAGEQAVDMWLSESGKQETGELGSIPDDATSDFIEKCESALKMYNNLYEGKNE